MFKASKLSYLVVALLPMSGFSQAFLFERGDYKFSIYDFENASKKAGQNHLVLKDKNTIPGAAYKWDKKRNAYQMKDWFLRDWISLQNMYEIDFDAYLKSQRASTFNQAKRRQYVKFPFHKKKFYHLKSIPTLKEWGGLTHPPLQTLTRPLQDYHSSFGPLDYQSMKSPYFDPKLQNELDDVSNSELTFDNRVEALEDQEAYKGKMWLIDKAQKSILMSSLVFVCDKSTRDLTLKLIEKHRMGVKVRVIVDGFISKILKHGECPLLMKNAGIEVIDYDEFFKHEGKAIYHTKTLIVDDVEAIAGGQNMIDADNTSRGTDFKNRDIDLYAAGPMVRDMSRQFIENWNYHVAAHGDKKGTLTDMMPEYKVLMKTMREERSLGLRGKNHYEQVLGTKETRMKGVCRFIKQAPHIDRHTVGKAYMKLLDKVSKHLVITDPIKADTFANKRRDIPLIDRFDPFEMFNQLHARVQNLARMGKKIDYITTNVDMAGNENVAMMNEKIREQLQNGQEFKANWSFFKLFASNKYYAADHYKNLLTDWVPHPSVNVWTHISFMHSKIFYFDRIVSSIGSVNFQHNATDQAYESTAICMDEDLNHQLDRILVKDMANSIPLIYSQLQ